MVDGARLRALVSEYARTTLGRYDISDVLYRLSDRCLAALEVDGAGISVADPDGRLRFVTATTRPSSGSRNDRWSPARAHARSHQIKLHEVASHVVQHRRMPDG